VRTAPTRVLQRVYVCSCSPLCGIAPKTEYRGAYHKYYARWTAYPLANLYGAESFIFAATRYTSANHIHSNRPERGHGNALLEILKPREARVACVVRGHYSRSSIVFTQLGNSTTPRRAAEKSVSGKPRTMRPVKQPTPGCWRYRIQQ
jgi:hypothetical protein